MMAYSETYRAMTRMSMAAADELCGGRLVLSHEGGYSPLYVPFCGLAVMEELSGVKTPVDDPMAAARRGGGRPGPPAPPGRRSSARPSGSRSLRLELQVLVGRGEA